MNKKIVIFFLILFCSTFFSYAAEYVLPTKIYGQVLIKDIPVEGLKVTAHYIDINNEYRSEATTTLNRVESRLKMDSSLIGYYFFDDIRSLPGTNIIIDISQTKHNFLVPSNPGKIVKVTTLSLNLDYVPLSLGEYDDVLPPEEIKDEATILELINISEYSPTEDFFENVSETEISSKDEEDIQKAIFPDVSISKEEDEKKSFNLMEWFNTALIIGLLIGLFIAAYFLFNISKDYITKAVSKITLSPSKASARKILNKKVRDFSVAAGKISKNAGFQEALTRIVFEKRNTLFVVDEHDKCIGKIGKEELFNIDINKIDISNLKVKEFMSSNIIIIKNDTELEEVHFFMEEEDLDIVGISDNNALETQIALFDLLKQTLNYKGNITESFNIRHIMKKDFYHIDKKQGIIDAKKRMIEDKTDFMIVLENDSPVGIFTVRDYLEGVLKYGKNILKNNVESVMSTSIVSMIPDLNILSANKIIIEKGFKNYPVKYEEQIQGIITQKIILNYMIKIIQNEVKD